MKFHKIRFVSRIMVLLIIDLSSPPRNHGNEYETLNYARAHKKAQHQGIYSCFLRTKMLNTDHLEATLDADMKNLPAEVQRSVCNATLSRVKCLTSGFLNGAARDDPNEVVHEMALAVRESTPKAYYMAGGHVDCLVRWLFGVVPAELTDAWLSLFSKLIICGARLKVTKPFLAKPDSRVKFQ